MGRRARWDHGIAVQIPGNFETPSHAAVRALARWRAVCKATCDIPFVWARIHPGVLRELP